MWKLEHKWNGKSAIFQGDETDESDETGRVISQSVSEVMYLSYYDVISALQLFQVLSWLISIQKKLRLSPKPIV